MSFAGIDLKTSASLQKLDAILRKIEAYPSGGAAKGQANGAAPKQEKGKPQKVTNAAAAAAKAVPAPQQGARAPASRAAAAPAGNNITDISWTPDLPPGHSSFSWSEDVNPADGGSVAATPTTTTGTIAPATKTKAEQKPKTEAKKEEPKPKEDNNKGKDKQQKQQAQQQKPKDKKAEPAAAAPAPESNQPAFTRLELRVGKIISAAKHPNADKMYVEQIDLGEGQPRQICSGLVGRVPIEDLPNALCVVVANLKLADLRGQKSEGMILAASSADDTKASLVLAPAGSTIGERVFLQTDGDNEKKLSPDPAGSIDVRKAGNPWALVAPDLKTDAAGRVSFKGTALVSSKGPVTSQLTDCKVK